MKVPLFHLRLEEEQGGEGDVEGGHQAAQHPLFYHHVF